MTATIFDRFQFDGKFCLAKKVTATIYGQFQFDGKLVYFRPKNKKKRAGVKFSAVPVVID